MERWWHEDSKYLLEHYQTNIAVALFGKDLEGNHTPLGDVYLDSATGKFVATYYFSQRVEAEFETLEEAKSFLLVLSSGDMDVLMFTTK